MFQGLLLRWQRFERRQSQRRAAKLLAEFPCMHEADWDVLTMARSGLFYHIGIGNYRGRRRTYRRQAAAIRRCLYGQPAPSWEGWWFLPSAAVVAVIALVVVFRGS